VRWVPDTRETRQEIYIKGLIVLDEYDPTAALWQHKDIEPISIELTRTDDKWHPDPVVRDIAAEDDGGTALWKLRESLTDAEKGKLVAAVANFARAGLKELQLRSRDRADLLPIAQQAAVHLETLQRPGSPMESRLEALWWYFVLLCSSSGALASMFMFAGVKRSLQDINRD